MEKFQDKFGKSLTMDERVAGFDVLEVKSKARSFVAIKSDAHAWAWMDRQIRLKMATHKLIDKINLDQSIRLIYID
ncbi:hypothetical protein Pst134EB_012446 [Puccinia striiformis f. sp. tritici]|nr:hypothetical protein Pst134EB_012446 [Puccinia striiformis f. sp. tritici]